jgi:uncharacterized protein YndB with AHSA1/START domain
MFNLEALQTGSDHQQAGAPYLPMRAHRERRAGHRSSTILCAIVASPLVFFNTASAAKEEGRMSHYERSHAIQIVWHFNSPPEQVWRAWTDPDYVARWWGSNPTGKVLSAKLAVQPGGGFEVKFIDPDGTQHTSYGVYEKVEPYRLLAFTWNWESEPSAQTFVTVALAPEGNGTRMQFEHSGLIYASSHDYAEGWKATFAKLERAMAVER